jgi:hypothetical protein
MTNSIAESVASNLYDALAEPAPATAEKGDTIFTAAKETIDNDREEAEGSALLGAG